MRSSSLRPVPPTLTLVPPTSITRTARASLAMCGAHLITCSRRSGVRSLVLLPVLLAACTVAPPPDPNVIEGDGGSAIRRDVFQVPVAAPSANPDGTQTPPELNQVTVVRYRLDTGKQPP